MIKPAMATYCLTAICLLALTACVERSVDPAQPVDVVTESEPDLPAGTYGLEKSHAFVYAKADHLGFSKYIIRFTEFDATLEFDPAAPEEMSVSASVDVSSLETDFPYPEMEDFNATLRGPQWFDAAAHPQMVFQSESVALTGPRSADVTGPLTIRGVSKPATLHVTFNGGYKGLPEWDPNARIGFSANTTINRSDYGISFGLPSEEMIGVGDKVEIFIEAEFTGPPLEE